MTMIPSSKEERRADIVEYYKERITPYYSLRWHLGIMAYSNLIIEDTDPAPTIVFILFLLSTRGLGVLLPRTMLRARAKCNNIVLLLRNKFSDILYHALNILYRHRVVEWYADTY